MKTSSRVVITVLMVATATFCGMFAPLAFGPAVRNAVWDPLFGIGFWAAGFVFHPFTANRMVGLIGGVIWPLLLIAGIAFGAWRFTAVRPFWRLAAGGLFVVSVFMWVSLPTANRLSLHGVPFYTIYFSVLY